MTQIRVYQTPLQVVHDQIPANTGTAQIRKVAMQVVHNDLPALPLHVLQVPLQVVHDQFPADTGTAHVRKVAIQVVRSVAEQTSGGGDRRTVTVLIG